MTDTLTYAWTGTANASPSTETRNGTLSRTNVMKDPGPRVSGTWSAYIVGPTNSTAQVVSRTDTASKSGYLIVFGNSAAVTAWNASAQGQIAVTAGTTYTFSMSGIHTWTGGSTRLTVEFKDSAGKSLGYFYPVGSTTLAPNVLTQITNTQTAPAGAVAANIFWDAGGTLPPAGAAALMTSVLVAAASSAGQYFDGATPTVQGDFAPKLTLFDDDVLGPRVQALFPLLATGTQTVVVRRTAGGRTMSVRGGVGLFAVGGASVLDAEVPFGMPVTYQAEQFDATGQSLGFTGPSSITVSEPFTWVSQPLSPGSAMRVRVRVASTGSLTRPSPGEVVVPEGATVGRIISGQRSGVQGTLVLSVGSPAAADAFDALWGGYGQDFPAVICIRTPPNVPLPPVLFWACLAPERQSSGANKAIRYVLPGTEVAPPSAGLVIPTLRRKDIDAAYPTRAARSAAYQSRIQRDTDYTKAGLAGP